MILYIAIMVGLLALSFKLVGFLFKVLGKILGFFFSVFGYAILGVLAFCVFGIALYGLPVLIIVGIISILLAAFK